METYTVTAGAIVVKMKLSISAKPGHEYLLGDNGPVIILREINHEEKWAIADYKE